MPEIRQPSSRAETGQPGSGGAAPAGKARNLALGRSRDPIGGHYDPSARCSLDWDRANGCRALGRAASQVLSRRRNAPPATGADTRKRGPGDRNRRRGAPRGARVLQKGTRQDLRLVRHSALHSLGVSRGR